MNSVQSTLDFLRGQPVITLFLALGAGNLLGRIRIAGFAPGPIAGTLLVSLLLGNFGFHITQAAQSVGFALFIFAVGYQAGPRFIEVLKTQGLRYFALAAFVAATGFVTAMVAGNWLDLPVGGTAGLLAGAMTTTPTLAAAQEAVRSGLVVLPAGTAAEQVIATIGTSYAITYIVGMLGVIAGIKLLPRIMGLDLAAEARQLDATSQREGVVQLQARGYRVSNAQYTRQSIGELTRTFWDGLSVLRLRRDGQWHKPNLEEHLQLGDEVYAFGDASFFRRGITDMGEEIPVHSEIELSASSMHVVVARRDAVGRTLDELDLARKYGLAVLEVRRDGLLLPIGRHLQLERGDILNVVGPTSALPALSGMLGPVEANAVETDMMAFAFGIALGSAIGLLSVTVAGVPIGLGAAGGLLIAGIVTGWLNSVRPNLARFPESARWILMEFGLLIFMCGVGLQAGGQIVETLRQAGVALIATAVFVVTLPLLAGYVFGAKVLRLHPVLLLGALTGAMTSAPALSMVASEVKSATPALGYTGTYAFANVLLTIAGTLIMLL